jgi:hypothetical protein
MVLSRVAPIRRLTEGSQQWRVLVETWEECDAVLGRLLFRPDASRPLQTARASAALLRGASMEDVVACAHDMPESHLRRVLHSLA